MILSRALRAQAIPGRGGRALSSWFGGEKESSDPGAPKVPGISSKDEGYFDLW